MLSSANGDSVMKTLPGDEIRQVQWRFSDRFDLQMLVQSARSVARGLVARLVASGARNTHEWTEEKAQMLTAFDEAGITSVFMDPEDGGYIEGPKNFALALLAFELAWVDGGAATGSLAGNLALEPIKEKGTEQQRSHYMKLCVPPAPGDTRKAWRGAFALTEPIPYVGVDTGVLGGKVRIARWNDGEEPILHVEKRGRFITNMGFANFVCAAVDSDDPRIKGSCMVILEEGDPGVFDRGTPTKKLVHQLSSTTDPVFSLDIPASRIIGGYSVKDGVIVPQWNHSQIIESVFRRTRVTVGLMTSAKLLSAIEPVIRYQRGRFRGGASGAEGTPRHDLGLQMKEDPLHRLIDVWATGEASASLGFATARLFDEFDPLERETERLLGDLNVAPGRAQMRTMMEAQKRAIQFLEESAKPESGRYSTGVASLPDDTLVRFAITDAITNVLCPATKLWNTGHGANMMREAVSLMGGYGITEDCPGFLGMKWMDAQLEATYEGPEAVQRRQLSVTMANELFLTVFRGWIREMRGVASEYPETGACTLASAMELWLWSLTYLLEGKDADGRPLFKDQRQGVTFPMADALSWLLASRCQILDTIELAARGAERGLDAEALPGYVRFFSDLCHVQAARAAGETSRVCSLLVYGYNRHPGWKDEGACVTDEELVSAESLIPGSAAGIAGTADAIAADGTRATKAGPCAGHEGLETFQRLQKRLHACLSGSALAKDRAARALTSVSIPEALDYPA